MTDRYADIRAALDAGPTPGPWFTHRSLGLAVATVGIHRIVSDAEPVADPTSDIRYIAACHPEAIRALLAERDALREALANLVRGYVYTLEGGRDRIVSLGGQCDPVDVMEAADPYLRAARAALAQEHGEKNDNQD